MNARASLELLNKYSNCKECGSDKVGNGEGTLEINDDVFKRTCKCGWEVEFRDEIDRETKTHRCPACKLPMTQCNYPGNPRMEECLNPGCGKFYWLEEE